MRYISLAKGWFILPIYFLAGLLLGLSDPELGSWAQQQGLRPGYATAAIVNILLPLVTIGLGVAWPRQATAWLGAALMTTAFALGLAIMHPEAHGWEVARLLGSIKPVLVLACVGYGVLGSLTAMVSQRVWK